MTPQRRSRPLTVADIPEPPARAAVAAPPPVAAAPREDDPASASRREHFFDGVRALRVSGGGFRFDEHTLMVVGGVLAPVGLMLVLLGWYGAAHTPNLFEQVPYLISGGLFGVALVFLGSFFYFAHWMTELVKENRRQSAAVVAAIDRLESRLGARLEQVSAPAAFAAAQPSPSTISTIPTTNGSSSSNGTGSGTAHPVIALVATGRGTMAHRLDCVVVATKTDVRAVDAADGLQPCKLCDPYAAGV